MSGPRPLPDPREFYWSGLILFVVAWGLIGGGAAWLAAKRWGQ